MARYDLIVNAYLPSFDHSFSSSAASACACSAGACSVGMRTRVCGSAASLFSEPGWGLGSLAGRDTCVRVSSQKSGIDDLKVAATHLKPC